MAIFMRCEILSNSRIVRATSYEGHFIVGMFPMYYVYNVLLITLQILHFIWFAIILRLLREFLTTGKVMPCSRML